MRRESDRERDRDREEKMVMGERNPLDYLTECQ